MTLFDITALTVALAAAIAPLVYVCRGTDRSP